MLRIVQNSSTGGAKRYYSTADYYSEGQELQGQWRGLAAKRLGLSGLIDRADWDALCDNHNPTTGAALTQRQNDKRRIGYDFNFHVPKSVSVLYGLTQDQRILDAFKASVNETMDDMESEMKTRVRARGKNEDRVTGNMIWGEFVHFTARPVDGVPDPHLHAHCFVFNSTFDARENRWKAGQFADLKRDAPFFEAVFHSRLARRMEELGLPVERTRQGWELSGIPKVTLERFSRRTKVVEQKAKEKGITDAAEKSELGAKTREKKREGLTTDQLRAEWQSRLSEPERETLASMGNRLGGEGIAENERIAAESAIRSVSHAFERKSVVAERMLLADAMKRSFGAALPATVIGKMNDQGLIVAERDGRRMATARSVLNEERQMIALAREGRGTCPRLGDALYPIKRDWLNDGQRRAVRHVLNSPDRVILIRGAAGTGKTTMMQEAVEAIEANGKRVFTFAPSAGASRGVLRTDGFTNAETVARLLLDEKLQAEIRGQVIWIDEAGLLGTKTMAEVFDLADRLDARVILSGDRKQHGSVERGAALRLLEEEAGVVPAEIREIQRQKDAYKDAVQALSDGHIENGFRELDRLGWVREVPQAERYKTLASDYVETLEEGKSALVVSPTHLEGEWITDEIRAQLKQCGRLGGGEHRLLALENANLTEAERSDPLNYEPGDVIVFHQNAKGHQKGERVVVGDAPLPLSEASKFQVFHPAILPVAPGDVLRITRNGTTLDGKHRLNNGEIVTVKNFDARGNVVLKNGWTVAKDFGHLAHGYVVTSHASQGRTVDRVFIGESSASFPAASREQFYVSCSRGRESLRIYCDDKAALLDAVSRSDDRLTATELVMRDRGIVLQRLERLAADSVVPTRDKDRDREGVIYDR